MENDQNIMTFKYFNFSINFTKIYLDNMQHLKIINKESLRPSLKPNIRKRPLQPSKVLNTSVMTYSEN